jgi:hypothetical protein
MLWQASFQQSTHPHFQYCSVSQLLLQKYRQGAIQDQRNIARRAALSILRRIDSM